MPRYRKLHVKTVESLDLNDMPDDLTRLFWVLLPLALCREGRGLDNAAWLKSRLFPLREDINQDDVYTAFVWCCERGMIELYHVDGRGYFYVPTFHKYQGNTTKEAESDYPPPPVQSESESDQAEVKTNSRPTPELVQSKSDTDAVFNIQYSDADADASGANAPHPYLEIREAWLDLFPDKPKPREDNKTLRGKAKTRWKSDHFRENWREAMTRASKSTFCNSGGWFDLGWFLKNGDNYEKCLNGNYDDGANSRDGPGQRSVNLQELGAYQ